MKKSICFLLCVLLCFGVIGSSNSASEYILEPGIYKVGQDIPVGHYDIRMKGLEQYCTIRYSMDKNSDGTLNMDMMYAYELIFSSKQNYWQGCHPNILLMAGDYLEIVNSSCVFYPIETSQF